MRVCMRVFWVGLVAGEICCRVNVGDAIIVLK